MFNSGILKGTEIRMGDGSTKPIEELVVGDKVMTNRQGGKGIYIGNITNITKLGKKLVQRSDTVKVTLSNGSEIVVTKGYPFIGDGKAAGWQVYDAFAYVKSHTYKKVTTIKELEDFIKSQVEEINEMHAGIHPTAATEWYASGQPPNERADTTRPGSMHPSGRQSGNFPGRLGVGKEIYCDDGETLSKEEIVSLEELSGDEKEEMYCVGTNMFSNEITGPTIFANGICIGAGENTAYGEL